MKEYHNNLRIIAKKVTRFFKKTFSEIRVEGPEISPHIFENNRVMAVSSHRSHVDYFLLGERLHNMGLNNLRFAAGDNLTELPIIGKKFKNYGAFAVERDKTYGRKYLRSLCDKAAQMINSGDNLIVFPESGRSYKGNMMEIRSVIICSLVIAQFKNPHLDHYIFPATISYEQLPELLYFDLLQKGKKIRQTKKGFLNNLRGNAYYFGSDLLAFAKFILANKIGKKYGSVFIDYAKPVALNDIVDLKSNYNAKARDEISAHRASLQKISEEIYKYFISLYRILPMHVMANILKNSGRITKTHAEEKVPPILSRLEKEGRNMKSLITLSPEEIVEKGISQLHTMKAVVKDNGTIRVKNRSVIKYYSATIDQKAR